MTIKITESLSKPLLGGARIAGNSSQQFQRPETTSDSLIEDQGNLDEVEMASDSSDINPKKEILHSNTGLTGLSNLGNTCFMNCVLQALANIKELRDYFLSARYKSDINMGNPLGTGGILAKAFCITLKHMWSGASGTYSPYELKRIVAKHAPQFVGFMQHDAQEFLAFFLDLLHEDVNRILDKPLFEMPDLSSFPDEEIAEETWRLYKSRNDSFVVDMFHGMLKSKLTCPKCSRQSTTFDPFVFLPVPIPQGKKKMKVFYIGSELEPTVFEVLVPGDGTASYLFAEASRKFSLPSVNLSLYKITSNYSCEKLVKTSSLSFCQYSTLFMFENSNPSREFQSMVVVQRQKSQDICQNCMKNGENPGVKILRCAKCKQVGYCSQDCQKSDWPKHKLKCCLSFMGLPFIIRSQSKTVSQDSVLHQLERWLAFSVDIINELPVSKSEHTRCATKLSSLYEANAFALFSCSNGNLKECNPLKGKKAFDLDGVTHIIIEWRATHITVSPKVTKSSGVAAGPNINDCLSLFTEPEILAAEEAWHCPGCKENQRATKELSLWKLPEVLIIQLKRFSLQNRIWRQKVDDMIDFPINGLDLRPFCVNDQDIEPVYDLFAVANHHGGLFGGHYTSYVTMSGGSGPGWRFCDDSNVTRIRSLDQLVTKSSYVMFYRRRKNGSNAVPTSISGGVSMDTTYKQQSSNTSPKSPEEVDLCKKTSRNHQTSNETVIPKFSSEATCASVKNGKPDSQKFSSKEDSGSVSDTSQENTSKSDSGILLQNEPDELPYTDMDAVD